MVCTEHKGPTENSNQRARLEAKTKMKAQQGQAPSSLIRRQVQKQIPEDTDHGLCITSNKKNEK